MNLDKELVFEARSHLESALSILQNLNDDAIIGDVSHIIATLEDLEANLEAVLGDIISGYYEELEY